MDNTVHSLVFDTLSGIYYGNAPISELLAADPTIESGTLQLVFSVPMESMAADIAEALQSSLGTSPTTINAVEIDVCIPQAPTLNFGGLVNGVKNIIAVASGKGGVGKSTTAVNLALALSYEGARVGLLDADIYGPSQPAMLGVDGKRPEVKEGNRIVPLEAYGISLISMGNLVTEKTPMIWRGPMVSGALQQLLMNTDWPDVDYLIVDMPPGTGDIPLTLSQKVPVTGSVIVTTPQDIALLDAQKGIEMFTKVNIPVFGVVENMAVHTCSSCGHEEHIFGESGGERLAQKYGVDALGSLPLAMSICEQTDKGRPPVAVDPVSEISVKYRGIAKKVAVAVVGAANQVVPEITIN